MTTEIHALYTRLPAIDRLLRDPAFSSLLVQHGHSQVVTQLRQMLDEAREQIRQCQTLPDWSHDWLSACAQRLTASRQSALRPVFNPTGTVLHTNLRRAIQAEAAVEAVVSAMRAPVTLEYDLDDAGRGHRDRAIADLLCQITGAEDACIVNNNAAAVLLMLAATASGLEPILPICTSPEARARTTLAPLSNFRQSTVAPLVLAKVLSAWATFAGSAEV
ncbi:L-seryl-tRNA(Sec) selenium transferase [Klebsiella quasipneumoniae subsp. similipneumoniae]|nr:L-seryl-tRNA(Sec) selenium transferase [Klebsiella quasipneumoniae subsp. similipneumoniae]